jgi:hypothetical protein
MGTVAKKRSSNSRRSESPAAAGFRLSHLSGWESNHSVRSVTNADELLSVEEAAAVLGVGVQRMYNLRHKGQGPLAFKRGRLLVYPRDNLVAFLVRERELTMKGDGR